MDIEVIIKYLKEYDGPQLKLMEVCGTHTSSIFKSGIRSLISPKIKLISGPGCPVCVTPTSYIDKCIEYALKPNHVIVTFGDMMKVPGEDGSLSQVKGDGAKTELMYSPLEVVEKAKLNPDITYVIAAVGFETTVPAYALTIEEAVKQGIKNIKIITALKTVMPALEWICTHEEGIDGFICPGHVSVIIGSEIYEELAEKYNKPFVVAGFEAEHILAVIYDIVKQIEQKNNTDKNRCEVHNLYTNAVRTEGNKKAQTIINKYFKPGPAMWRGLGVIDDSGLYLKDEYLLYDGGSFGLDSDKQLSPKCRCAEVIIGRINPNECPMFGESCDPTNPYGPCMVSAEGACGIWYRNT
ncbi:hydrogenase formation protein HypD [Anaerovorax odorimutans]|uniref:hydrogenase formation protein HypD n=1 Tax=Anaerovorax odorimutans TaxID=109327 RepID=UPI0003F6AF99|nr:hydrogenase formation protein HypD [Anaerovorax odorimutans]